MREQAACLHMTSVFVKFGMKFFSLDTKFPRHNTRFKPSDRAVKIELVKNYPLTDQNKTISDRCFGSVIHLFIDKPLIVLSKLCLIT